jgi:RNA recognition motif-containing protein
MMSNRLLIGNLSIDTTEHALKQFFFDAGFVRSEVFIGEPQTGKNRGFAFVALSDRAEAERASTALHGAELDGRAITVNLNQPANYKCGASFLARCMRLFRPDC